MQPIPRAALTHTASLETRTGTDADNNGIFSTAVDLSHIRCEPVKAWVNATNGEMRDDKLTLFFDCVNSVPASAVFEKGDRVTHKGIAYTVREVKDYAPHHFEVMLK